MSEGPCCDDCYNSHGDCLERGTCLCHEAYDSDEVSYVWCKSRVAADHLASEIRSGSARLESAVTVCGGALRTRYPDGRVRERRVVDACVITLGHVVLIRLGEVLVHERYCTTRSGT